MSGTTPGTMYYRQTTFGLLMAFFFASGLGCNDSESRSSNNSLLPQPAMSPETVAWVHWVGKKQLGIEAGAYYFMRIWGLPETARLRAQTLDKLSSTPWRLLRGEQSVSNAPVALLRPLLDDILQDEAYCEISQVTNRPPQVVFAIRMDEPHAQQWETNLAMVFESLTGIRPSFGGAGSWSLNKHDPPNLIELKRIREWTLLGAAEDKNLLLDDVEARIRRYGVPYFAPPTNSWLEAEFDPSRVAHVLGLDKAIPGGLPRVSAFVTGDGGNVVVSGKLDFPDPLPLELGSWTVPTNLIHEPLSSFTAVRGLKPWLRKWKKWGDLGLDAPPNQFYAWAYAGSPYQTYFAAPLTEASNRIFELTQRLLEKGNPWLASRGYVSFERLQDANGVSWGRLPSIRPFFEAVGTDPRGMVYGGLVPATREATNHSVDFFYHPTFAQLQQEVEEKTNLVWFHWELTGPRIDSWLYIGQFLRLISHRTQLPLQSAGAIWLSALVPRGGDCQTVITRTGVSQLSFERRSIVGLTALELHMLVDWLESPGFPLNAFSMLPPP